MKSTKTLSLIAFSITTAFLSTAAITNTYNSAAQAAELVFNGGFELDPLVDPNNPNLNNPNITGWTKSGNLFDTSNIRIDNFPHTGNQGLSLGGFIDLSYLSQTLSTIPGQVYQLTYYLASTDSPPALDNEFQAFVGGEKLFDQKNISFQPYTEYQFTFQAKDTSTELKFGSVDRRNFLYLDDVSVQPVSAQSVPEPSILGGTAVAGVLGIWLKKKKKPVIS